MSLGQSLQGLQRIGHHEERSLGIVARRYRRHDKGANATTVQLGDIVTSVATRGLQSKEKGRFGKTETATVCEQPVHLLLSVPHTMGAHKGCYGFQCICHSDQLLHSYFSISFSRSRIVVRRNSW